MSKKPLEKKQYGKLIIISIVIFVIAISLIALATVLQGNGVGNTVCYSLMAAATVMCIGDVVFLFSFYGSMIEYQYNQKSQKLEDTACEQLNGVTRESIKQACLQNGFKNKDSLYYHKRGISFLKDNVNYFVKTAECTDLQSALEKELEAFGAKGYKNNNKCFLLFLFKDGLTEDDIKHAADISKRFVLQETVVPQPYFDTAVIIPVDTTTKTAYYLPFSSRTAVYTYGIKMLKKLTCIS